MQIVKIHGRGDLNTHRGVTQLLKDLGADFNDLSFKINWRARWHGIVPSRRILFASHLQEKDLPTFVSSLSSVRVPTNGCLKFEVERARR